MDPAKAAEVVVLPQAATKSKVQDGIGAIEELLSHEDKVMAMPTRSHESVFLDLVENAQKWGTLGMKDRSLEMVGSENGERCRTTWGVDGIRKCSRCDTFSIVDEDSWSLVGFLSKVLEPRSLSTAWWVT
jgi:hypothetical protein